MIERYTRVVRIDQGILEEAERKRKELQQRARGSEDSDLWAFAIGAGLGAFLGYLIAKGLESIEK